MTIDLHGHFTPAAFLARLERRDAFPRVERQGDAVTVFAGPYGRFSLDAAHFDLDRRRSLLARLGYEHQLVSLSAAYGFDRLRGAEALDVAELVNTAFREAAAVDAAIYSTLAVVPLDAGAAGVNLLQRAIDAGHRGVILSASALTHLEHAESLDPLLAILQHHGGILFIHPGSYPELAGLPETRAAVSGVAFQHELAVALLRLLEWGVVTRFPAVKLLVCNLGGTLPFLVERLRVMGGEGLLPLLARVTYDCSSFGPRGIELAVAILGEERIVVGTDYPVQPLDRPLGALADTSLSEQTRRRILTDNAARLLDR